MCRNGRALRRKERFHPVRLELLRLLAGDALPVCDDGNFGRNRGGRPVLPAAVDSHAAVFLGNRARLSPGGAVIRMEKHSPARREFKALPESVRDNARAHRNHKLLPCAQDSGAIKKTHLKDASFLLLQSGKQEKRIISYFY